MAQRTIITDDLDGVSEARTVRFSFDGSDYEIDLGKKNTAAFEKTLKPYLDAARRVGGRRARAKAAPAAKRSGRRAANSTVNTAEVRQWALENGIAVSPRGRISGSIVEQYLAAH